MAQIPAESTEAKHGVNVYIAGPFAEPHHREALLHMIDIVRNTLNRSEVLDNLYIPMEYKVKGDFQKPDGTWNLPNHVWAKDVFQADIAAIENADVVIVLYDGRKGTTGTAWEIGYAYAKNIPVVGYIPEYARKEPMSLMVLNSFAGLLREDGDVATPDEWIADMDQK